MFQVHKKIQRNLENNTFYTLNYENKTNVVNSGLEYCQVEEDDLIYFKSTYCKDGAVVDYLTRSNTSHSFTSASFITRLSNNLKFVFIFESLSNISPSTATHSTVIHLEKQLIDEMHLTDCLVLELNPHEKLTSLIKKLLEKMETHLISQTVLYLKYLETNNSLLLWFNERQFIMSLKQKLFASFVQMKMLFPVETTDRRDNYYQENFEHICEFLQALIFNALTSEVDFYL
jgi:hypothetical protein